MEVSLKQINLLPIHVQLIYKSNHFFLFFAKLANSCGSGCGGYVADYFLAGNSIFLESLVVGRAKK